MPPPLAPQVERAHPRIDGTVFEREVLGQVVEQVVAARERLQPQDEGAVGLDIDGLDGVHLDGDGKAHDVSSGNGVWCG